MKVFPIKSPVEGEQVVGVTPNLDRFTDPDWRRRVNNFTGRALTHSALRSEQAGRSGRVAALGQMLSPGVVNGLLADKSVAESGQQMLNITAGHGIDANGEIVRMNSPLRVALNQIPVYAPVAMLDGADDVSEPGGELVRRLGPDLETAIGSISGLPRVAVLVLQPVQIEMNLEAGDDPCEFDAEAYAYENWQLVDGARLVLYSWPEEVLSLPGLATDMNWRNQLANSIFAYEKNLTASEVPPWTRLGVPLALVGFDASWQALFVDRHAVVRSGGKRRRAESILTDIGNRFLWQARFDQFNEQLVDNINALPAAVDIATESARHFRYLPPVGVLPKSFINLQKSSQNFFPLSYHVEALAVPYEQLDVIVQDSASLSVFDVNLADRVQALVPVPQIYFEPEILNTELLDPEFDFTISNFVESRNNWLGRRLEIRRKSSALNLTISGKSIDYPSTDKNAVDRSELASPFENNLVDHGEIWRYLKGDVAPPPGWNTTAFNDLAWSSGPGGFGYQFAGVETELNDMSGNFVSVYLRKKFDLKSVNAAKHYRLEILSNGGFVGYLNGSKISSHNLAKLTFDAIATKDLDADVSIFELDNLTETLVEGDNLIAFQVHASALESSGFIFSLRLVETTYDNDIEVDSYGITVKTNDSGEPALINGTPDYRVEELEPLRQFFESRTYKADDESIKLIWSQDEIDKFDAIKGEGLEDFIDFLQDKVNKANDKVDFGFVRLQTDIYRLRQFMLGNEEATKLATSPVLASIAKGQTAVATKEEISRVASILSSQAQANSSESDSNAGVGLSEPAAAELTLRSASFLSGGFELIDLTEFDDSTSARSGIDAAKQDFSVKNLSKESTFGSGQLFGDKTPGIREIEEQTSIVGSYDFFKNVTVGERLAQAVTKEAVDSGRSNRFETIVNIQNTGLSMDGVVVPGFKVDGEDTSLQFGSISTNVLQGIKDGLHEDVVEDNEASRFNSSVLNLERSTALLRLVEGRVKTYRVMIDRCKKSLSLLYSTRTQLDKRLKIIEDELAEARHDVAVSRALKAEELERIAAINLRRQTILDQQVPFLVFRRPRLSDVYLNAPIHVLNPDLSQAPLPICDIDEDETPEELSAMMEVVKDAPVKWFELADRVMKRINRLPDLQLLLKGARSRANIKPPQHRLLTQSYSGLNRLALGLNNTLRASHSLVMLQRQQTAAIDLARFASYGWQESRKRAAEVISIGDIIDGKHGRMGASKIAAAELEQISKVSVCLYFKLSQTLPSIRLDWAERLSQYDAPFNLRNLYSLPRWGEIEFIDRSEMQRLVDWLYARIDSKFSDASNLINELIRVCVLLASHAPVNQVISGLIPEPVQVKVGSKINIVANISRVRIGMNIAMVSGKNTLARGRVADIVGGQVQAQIISTASVNVLLEKNARVQIGEPRVTGGPGYQQNRALFRR